MINTAMGNHDRTPKKVLTQEDVFRIYRQMFGADPVITGSNFWESDKLIERILAAIDAGKPLC